MHDGCDGLRPPRKFENGESDTMKKFLVCLVLFLSPAVHVAAKNIDLSTVSPRDTVQLTIYNSEDLTLVRETRTVSLKKGVNPLQFSWANTLIDPTSVDLQFKSHADELDLLDTTFPHDKLQMLYWNVRSEFEGDATVEISYFTSGISWSADYVCISGTDETQMSLEGYVRITNNSGEDYADAQIRMVVGTINLVEKIENLARRGLISRDDLAVFRDGRTERMSKKGRSAVREELKAAADFVQAAPKQIVKEGLSEYFIFTVPGTETVKHMWSKRMRLFQGLEVPFAIQYRYRPAEYGSQLVRLFLLRNDEASGLGGTPLPDGVVRLFRRNGRDGLSFVVQQWIKYVPIGQEIKLNLGSDPEVIHELIRLSSSRDSFWFHRSGANVYYSLQEGHRIEIRDSVVGWDDHQVWVERIRNYRDKPIDVEIRRSFSGHVVFQSDLSPTLHDYCTPQFNAQIGAGKKRELSYELTIHQGYNKKEDNVTLERRS